MRVPENDLTIDLCILKCDYGVRYCKIGVFVDIMFYVNLRVLYSVYYTSVLCFNTYLKVATVESSQAVPLRNNTVGRDTQILREICPKHLSLKSVGAILSNKQNMYIHEISFPCESVK